MANEKKLPEINVDTGTIVEDAAKLVAIRAQKAELETQEKALIASIAAQAVTIRNEKLDAKPGEVIGLIRITGNNQAPIQVQFKIDSKMAPLDLEDEETLEELFKGARPMLFDKSTIVTGITEPEQLLQAIKDSGSNPWDFLKLSVKDHMGEIIARYPQAISSVQFMPKTGFASTLHDIWHTLGAEAIGYISDYVKKVLKPSVIAGSQGKGK
jgi:hypothetical protein